MTKETQKIAEFFDALSDETRVNILLYLINNGGKNVSEIHGFIGMTLPAISYQLKILYRNNLIDFEKKGREKYYHIADEHVSCILKDAVDHIKHSGVQRK